MKKGVMISLIMTILSIMIFKYFLEVHIDSIDSIHERSDLFTNKDCIDINIINATEDIKDISIVKLEECLLEEIYSKDESMEILRNFNEQNELAKYEALKERYKKYKDNENTSRLERLKLDIKEYLNKKEEVKAFLYDYNTFEINENYNHSKYYVDVSIKYYYDFYDNVGRNGWRIYQEFLNEEELIKYFNNLYKFWERPNYKVQYKCVRETQYMCYSVIQDDYIKFDNFIMKNNNITVKFEAPELDKSKYTGYRRDIAYALKMVDRNGKNTFVRIYTPGSYFNSGAESIQYDYSTNKIEFIYPNEFILQKIINRLNMYSTELVRVFLVISMILLKVFVSKLMQINATKKLVITHIILQPIYQVISIFIDIMVNGEVNNIISYYAIILIVNIIFSILEILLYTKIIKNETKKKIIIYTLATNIVPLFFVYIQSVGLMYAW